MKKTHEKMEELQNIFQKYGYYCTSHGNDPGTQYVSKDPFYFGYIVIGDTLCYYNNRYYKEWIWKIHGGIMLDGELKNIIEEIERELHITINVKVQSEALITNSYYTFGEKERAYSKLLYPWKQWDNDRKMRKDRDNHLLGRLLNKLHKPIIRPFGDRPLGWYDLCRRADAYDYLSKLSI